jgi:predicted GTPase
MRIVVLEKPKLQVVKMLCDEPIDAKLLKYPMVKTCWSMNSFNIIIGRMGVGKSSLMVSLLKSVFIKMF